MAAMSSHQRSQQAGVAKFKKCPACAEPIYSGFTECPWCDEHLPQDPLKDRRNIALAGLGVGAGVVALLGALASAVGALITAGFWLILILFVLFFLSRCVIVIL
jgi:hypothetical protein